MGLVFIFNCEITQRPVDIYNVISPFLVKPNMKKYPTIKILKLDLITAFLREKVKLTFF